MVWIAVGIAAFVLLAIIGVYVTRYRTAGPDEALIVTGSYLGSKTVHTDEAGNKIKIIRGGGTFVLPVFQQAATSDIKAGKSN